MFFGSRTKDWQWAFDQMPLLLYSTLVRASNDKGREWTKTNKAHGKVCVYCYNTLSLTKSHKPHTQTSSVTASQWGEGMRKDM